MGLSTNLRAFSAARLVRVTILSQRDSKQDRPTLCHRYFKIKDIINLIYFKFYIQTQLVKASKSLHCKFFKQGMSFVWDLYGMQ